MSISNSLFINFFEKFVHFFVEETCWQEDLHRMGETNLAVGIDRREIKFISANLVKCERLRVRGTYILN